MTRERGSDVRHGVSTRFVRNLLRVAEAAAGWPAVDLEAAGIDLATLENPEHEVPLTTLLALLEQLCGTSAERLQALGSLFAQSAGIQQLGHLSRVLDEETLYETVFGWEVPRNVPDLQVTVQSHEGRILVSLALPGVPFDARAFFELCVGAMKDLPRVLGGGEAAVTATVRAQHAEMQVDVTRSTTLGRLRMANERLERSERRWRALTDNLPGIVAVLDPDGIIHEAFGGVINDPGRLVGRCAFDMFREAEQKGNASYFREAFDTGRAVHFELPQDTADGLTRWWGIRGAQLPGREPRAVFVAFDLTERRRAQEALTATEERYLRAQKMEAIGRLAGGLAHDFNNVLAAIRGQAELLDQHADPVVRAAVATILGASDRATDLTTRLLSYGRHNLPEPTVLDLGAAMRDAGPLLEALAGKALELVWDLTDAPLPVRIDPTHLQQIVLNLLVNARDALDDGGIVWLSTRSENGQAVLEVVDNGAGMTEDARVRALEPFFTTKAVGRGTGLGLSTVYWIVDQVDGSIDLKSELGKGTRVVIRLPLAEPTELNDPEARQRDPMPRGRERILLAEDEPHVRATVTQMLEAQGYTVLPCADGAEALRFDVHEVDLLVTDVVMPGMSGTELARLLRKRRDDLPVLLLSGYTTEDPTTLDDGAGLGYLRKPFAMRDLAQEVRRLLDT